MTTNVKRLAVNAAIEQLIADTDTNSEAARIVIQYGAGFKKKSFEFEIDSPAKSSAETISGQSPDHGEVKAEFGQHQKREFKEFGLHKDRVGYFRLWKREEGQLVFHHFWKSSLTTNPTDTEEPDRYYLGYDTAPSNQNILASNAKRN